MAGEERKIPAPRPDPETKPFWDAAAEGRLMLRRCASCGRAHYFPRPICPFCFGSDCRWFQSKGTGTIYTFSVMRRAPVPYAIAYVTLDEDVTMMTGIVDGDLDAIRIGARVAVVFKPSEGGPKVPMFALA